MKSIIVANPRAGAGKVGRHWQQVSRTIAGCFGPADVRFTDGQGDATELVRRAVSEEGFERVVLVGGDGTVNEGLNGMFDGGGKAINPDASVAVYPAGTGGDLARSLGMSAMSVEEAYRQGSDRRVDVGCATFQGYDGVEVRRYFINISSVGVSGDIGDRVNRSSKALGGKASYMLGTVRGVLAYRNQRVRVRIDDTFERELSITLVAVANGRYFGGSMKIAPGAILDDGLFDVVIVGDLTLPQIVRNVRRLYEGSHVGMPQVEYHRGSAVTVTPVGNRPMRLDVDGENPGLAPVRYEVIAAALKVFAPWGKAEGVHKLPVEIAS